MKLALVSIVLFVVSLASPFFAFPLLKKLELLDTPNHRSSHVKATLRGGGITVAATVVIGLIFALFEFGRGSMELGIVLTILLAVMLTTSLGFIEDVWGISVRNRLLCQLAVSAFVALSMLYLTNHNPLWSAPLAIAGMFYINAANFMDGINGISSLHGVLLGVTAFAVGILESNSALLAIGAIVAIAFLGFLPWNTPIARLFLGDAGSYLIGGLFFTIGFWVYFETNSILLSIAPGLYYTFDVLITLAIRKYDGQDLTQAHRDHLYQQLQRRSGSHSLAALATTALSSITVLLALLSYQGFIAPTLVVLVSVALLLSALPLFREQEAVK